MKKYKVTIAYDNVALSEISNIADHNNVTLHHGEVVGGQFAEEHGLPEDALTPVEIKGKLKIINNSTFEIGAKPKKLNRLPKEFNCAITKGKNVITPQLINYFLSKDGRILVEVSASNNSSLIQPLYGVTVYKKATVGTFFKNGLIRARFADSYGAEDAEICYISHALSNCFAYEQGALDYAEAVASIIL